MLIQPYIFNDIKTFSFEDTVADAVKIAEDFSLTHILVVENGMWQGNFRLYDLLEATENAQLYDVKYCLERFSSLGRINLFEAVNLFQSNQSNILPIISQREEYLGCVVLEDIFNTISKFPLITEAAAMVTLKISQVNYSMSEITRIAEENNAKVYGAFILDYTGDMVEVAVKLNTDNLDSVLSAYERYGYMITYQSHLGDREELVKDRYEQLMKFIDV